MVVTKHSVYSLTIHSAESVCYVYATLFNTRVTITGANRNETLQAPTRIPTFTLPPRSKARIVKDDTGGRNHNNKAVIFIYQQRPAFC